MTLREKAHEIIDNISEEKMIVVVDFLEYLKIKEEVEATNEILNDENLAEAIQRGMAQYENGELVDFEGVLVNEKD